MVTGFSSVGITGKTRLVGVIGYPVEHSLSPPMHNAALAGIGIDAVYVPLKVSADDLKTAVHGLRAAGFIGVNVTIPHKVAVMQLLDEISPEAAFLGSVNTLYFADGKIKGYNTDGTGFLRSLTAAEMDPKGCVATLFGAGGAARPIALKLAQAGLKRLYIVNRSFDKALALARTVNSASRQQVAKAVEGKKDCAAEAVRASDLVVNATPVGMVGYAPDACLLESSWLHSRLFVYDTVYNPMETKLLAMARMRGCRTLSGVAMLVEQGAESFRIWFGHRPDTAVMQQAVLAYLK